MRSYQQEKLMTVLKNDHFCGSYRYGNQMPPSSLTARNYSSESDPAVKALC